jgi:hypothetical protein
MRFKPQAKSYTYQSGFKYIGGHIEFLDDLVLGRYIDTTNLDISMFSLRKPNANDTFIMRITFDDESYQDVWKKQALGGIVGFGAPREVFDLGVQHHIREIELFKEGDYNHDWLIWGGDIEIR